MKILEPQSAVLSNAEVLAHLTDITVKRRPQALSKQGRALKSPNFETVIKELSSSLAPSDPSPVPPYGTRYTPAAICNVMRRLEKFKFTKAELIMIINLRPQQPVFLDTIIEECDARLTSIQQEEALSIIRDILGGDDEGEPEHT